MRPQFREARLHSSNTIVVIESIPGVNVKYLAVTGFHSVQSSSQLLQGLATPLRSHNYQTGYEGMTRVETRTSRIGALKVHNVGLWV